MSPGWEDGRRWTPPENENQAALRLWKIAARWQRFPQLGPLPERLSTMPMPKDPGAIAAFVFEALYTPKRDPFSSAFLLTRLRRR